MIHYEHYRGNEEFVKRVYDLIELMERRKRVIVTPFFTPEECMICDRILGNKTFYYKFGGYSGAERCRYAFYPYEDEEIDMNICTLKAKYSSQFGELKHSDVLGAIMNLGIEREKIGDLIVQEDEIIIFIDKEIENYIVCNLTKIKRSSVHFSPYDGEITYTPKIQYQQKIVSSIRMDAVVATLSNVSRQKAQNLIKAGFVKLNHVVLEESSKICNNNSVISIRGYGRFSFVEVVKKTKKDHYVVLIGKYQ